MRSVENSHLAAGLLLAGEAPLDQAGDDRAIAEGALHQRGFREPGLEIVAQHVLVEQRVEIEPALADHQRAVAKPQIASAYSVATKPSGCAPARSSRRVSSMPSVWCASRPSKG